MTFARATLVSFLLAAASVFVACENNNGSPEPSDAADEGEQNVGVVGGYPSDTGITGDDGPIGNPGISPGGAPADATANDGAGSPGSPNATGTPDATGRPDAAQTADSSEGPAGPESDAGDMPDTSIFLDAPQPVDVTQRPEGASLSLTIVVGLSGALHLSVLNWTINGPNHYSGTVEIGDAQSLEFVIGGILAADGYTITLYGTDPSGTVCTGTSASFSVHPGETSAATVVMSCLPGGGVPADGSTGP